MITLDYRTYNPRWGLSGIVFQNWENYSNTIGYLSNPNHYINIVPQHRNADVSLHIESNNEQGAWDKEGRIHYYGSLQKLENNLNDLYACSSAGTGRITRRINSNGFILSLVYDYNFQIKTYYGFTTADVFPPEYHFVKDCLFSHLKSINLDDFQIENCLAVFDAGYEA